MRWAFLDRWGGLLRLVGLAKGDPGATLVGVDDAFGAAGAAMTDVRFLGGMHVTFHFELAPSDLPGLAAGLADAGVELDADSLGGLAEATKLDRNVVGTLALTLLRGDPDQKNEIPRVPG